MIILIHRDGTDKLMRINLINFNRNRLCFTAVYGQFDAASIINQVSVLILFVDVFSIEILFIESERNLNLFCDGIAAVIQFFGLTVVPVNGVT